MNAQEIINQTSKEDSRKENLLNLFYPDLSAKLTADSNLSKLARGYYE